MSKIDTTQWKEYSISDLFITENIGRKTQVPTGCYIEKKLLKDGQTPRITVTGINNGIYGYFEDLTNNSNYRVYENFISVSFLGTVFYHPYKASLDMKVHSLKLKNRELNEYIGGYIVSVIKKSIQNNDYADQISSTVLPHLKMKLPADINGNPNFAYMEKYMQNLESTVSSSLNALRSAKSSKTCEKVDIVGWGKFEIGALFDVRKGKRLTKANMIDGNIPFVGASSFNNGRTAHIGNTECLHPGNSITMSYNGSVGEAFYQEEEFWASDDVNVLYPKIKFNRNIAMFIIPLLKKVGTKYAFVDKWKKDDMEKDCIYLPIKDKDKIDFDYIEDYIQKKYFACTKCFSSMVAI